MFDTRLPQPSDSFRWVQAGSQTALACRVLEPIVPHFFTTRDWALGSSSGGDKQPGWAEVAGAMAVGVDDLLRVHQVHGAAVVVRRAGARPALYQPADIIITDDPTAAVAVQAADCVPLLLVDRRTGVVAAAHAGWRGLAAGVPRATVDALAKVFGSRAADLVAAVGPSVGACCYEVGPDVRQRFDVAGFPSAVVASWFRAHPQPTLGNPSMAGLPPTRREGHWFFDSGSAARDALALAGVPTEQIFVAGLCTASHPATLCSYRRDGAGAGRLAAVIRPRGV